MMRPVILGTVAGFALAAFEDRTLGVLDALMELAMLGVLLLASG